MRNHARLVPIERSPDPISTDKLTDAIINGDGKVLRAAIKDPGNRRAWREALRRVARLGAVPARSRAVFMRFFVSSGHLLRVDVGDHLLVRALPVLLPSYRGGPVTLYRGMVADTDGGFEIATYAHNAARRGMDDIQISEEIERRRTSITRRRRKRLPYGFSWSARYELARAAAFAHRALLAEYDGGQYSPMLLATSAPAAAIISRVPRWLDRLDQDEFIVDPRRLMKVEVEQLVEDDPGINYAAAFAEDAEIDEDRFCPKCRKPYEIENDDPYFQCWCDDEEGEVRIR